MANKLLDKVFGAFGYERRSEAYQSLGDVLRETGSWTQAGTHRYDRSLYAPDQQLMINRSYALWTQNVFARRVIETLKNFVIGDGITIRAKDPKVQECLDAFWTDPINRMDERAGDLCRDLSIFGEAFVPLFVNPYTGQVNLGAIDPMAISKINANPMNHHEVHSVEMTQGVGNEKKVLRCVHVDEFGTAGQNEKSYEFTRGEHTKGLKVGEIFYWSVNRPTGAVRGIGDIYHLSDWLERQDELMMVMLDRARLSNYAVFKCKARQATLAQLRNFANPSSKDYIPPPKPGSVVWENDSMEWTLIQVNLNASDMAEAARTFLLPIGSGSGQPIHWFGTGEDTNRASALEMNSPAHKALSERQGYFVYGCIYELLEFVRDQKRIFRPQEFSGVTDFGFEVVAPDIGMRDEAARASVLREHMTAISIAQQNGAYGPEQTAELMKQALQRAGFEVDEISLDAGEIKKTLDEYTKPQPPENDQP